MYNRVVPDRTVKHLSLTFGLSLMLWTVKDCFPTLKNMIHEELILESRML